MGLFHIFNNAGTVSVSETRTFMACTSWTCHGIVKAHGMARALVHATELPWHTMSHHGNTIGIHGIAKQPNGIAAKTHGLTWRPMVCMTAHGKPMETHAVTMEKANK